MKGDKKRVEKHNNKNKIRGNNTKREKDTEY